MPFDINERDATGRNILYMACLVDNKKLLDVILKFRVKATRLMQSDEDVDGSDAVTPVSDMNPIVSPTRRRISNGIQSIMSKLSLSRDNSIESGGNSDVSIIFFVCF